MIYKLHTKNGKSNTKIANEEWIVETVTRQIAK